MKKLSLCCLVFAILPTVSMAKYCVQVASVREVAKKSLVDEMQSKVFRDEPLVRVEKLGKYYTLRVGDFSTMSSAKPSLSKIKQEFPHAYIRECTPKKTNVIYASTFDQNNFDQEDDLLPQAQESSSERIYKHSLEKKEVSYLPSNYETHWSPNKEDTF